TGLPGRSTSATRTSGSFAAAGLPPPWPTLASPAAVLLAGDPAPPAPVTTVLRASFVLPQARAGVAAKHAQRRRSDLETFMKDLASERMESLPRDAIE